MKTISLTVLTIVLLGTFSVRFGGVQTDVADTDEAQLRHIKTVLWVKAYREQDTALLDKILHQNFRSIDDQGNVTGKADELDYIRKNKPTYASFRFDIERLEIFHKNFAVVSGAGTIQSAGKNGKQETKYRSSNHFLLENGKWQAISSHVSGVKTVKVTE